MLKNMDQDLIMGNVTLSGDRAIGQLLVFPSTTEDQSTIPDEGWPCTAFVSEAVFYVAAEQTMESYVKQQRRIQNSLFILSLYLSRTIYYT